MIENNEIGGATLKKIINNASDFTYPNPISLIKYILSFKINKNATILDFFAGSGTTAQAVLELNKEDGGNRKFILCTNNENGICENITYERIKTVITGNRADGSKYSDGIKANLKYFKTDFLSKEDDEIEEKLCISAKELMELEYAVDIDNKNYFLLTEDEDLDALIEHWDEVKDTIKKVYIRRNVFGSTSDALEKIDGVEKVYVPECYFEKEMAELGID